MIATTRQPYAHLIDLTGKRFGRLLVLNISATLYEGVQRGWDCVCDCGTQITTRGSLLRKGKTLSCGCLQKELTSDRSSTHGMSKTKIYAVWRGMINRCCNPRQGSFKRYGALGVSVSPRWMKFENFLSDMGDRPSDDHSIDRFPDKGGNYEPGNCRWATLKQQANNTKSNHVIECDGRSMTVAQWSDELGIGGPTIRHRLKSGWSAEAALTTPVQ